MVQSVCVCPNPAMSMQQQQLSNGRFVDGLSPNSAAGGWQLEPVTSASSHLANDVSQSTLLSQHTWKYQGTAAIYKTFCGSNSVSPLLTACFVCYPSRLALVQSSSRSFWFLTSMRCSTSQRRCNYRLVITHPTPRSYLCPDSVRRLQAVNSIVFFDCLSIYL